MKKLFGFLLIACLSTKLVAGEYPTVPRGMGFPDVIEWYQLWWTQHECFTNADVARAKNLIHWQRNRIAELEAKCGDACK